jgi:hypothetical protein
MGQSSHGVHRQSLLMQTLNLQARRLRKFTNEQTNHGVVATDRLHLPTAMVNSSNNSSSSQRAVSLGGRVTGKSRQDTPAATNNSNSSKHNQAAINSRHNLAAVKSGDLDTIR